MQTSEEKRRKHNEYMKKWWAEHKNDPNVQQWRTKSLQKYNSSYKHRKADRKWYYSDLEHSRELGRQHRQSYAERNPEKIIQIHQKHYWKGGGRTRRLLHYQNNKSYVLAVNKAWTMNNRARKNFLDKQHRLRKRNAIGSHTLEDWQNLCEKYNYRCLACNLQKPLTEDHIIPLTRGGTDYIDNIQPLCASCNSKKGQKTIDYRKDYE